MVVFPNCKINLGLNILRKRADGFHDLETIFYPVPLKDSLEIITNSVTETFEYSTSGINIDGNTQDNLCFKAYELLKNDFPQLPSIKMHLHKAIPTGAGLGGGSADGAFTLKLLNDQYNLGLTNFQLLKYAETLGSDGPFFIINQPCFATGKGEKLETISVSLKGYQLILINPGIHINTGWAFSQLTPALPAESVKECIKQPITAWKGSLQNDFEIPVFEKYPQLKNIKSSLYEMGAIYASMTGSGSTIFGVYDIDFQPVFDMPKEYLLRSIAL